MECDSAIRSTVVSYFLNNSMSLNRKGNMDWEEFKLKNGLKVIYKIFHEFHSATIGIWIKVGSRFENKNISGISHFIEHLLFKGTKKRNCRQIKESIEGVGGNFNGFTSEEVTCYWIKILGEHVKLSIDVLSDMIRNPLMKKTDIEKERKVIIEEINMYKDQPARYVHELFDHLLFSTHPLGRGIAGSIKSIQEITRKTILNFQHNFYSPENIVLSVSGNFSETELRKTSEKYLGNMQEKEENQFSKCKMKPAGPKAKLLFKETEQVHFCLGGFGFSRLDKKRYPVGLLNLITGGNMSSRLFNKVREQKGLAYQIRSYTRSYQDTGTFVISAGVAPSKTMEALKVIMEELRRIKEKGIKEKELFRAKKFLISQFLMGLEDNLEYMMWLGEQKLLKKKLTSINETVKNIMKVEKEEVENIAQKLFHPENFYLSLIGPVKEEEKILRIIKKI